jgi:glutathione-regulated potassium-efflux system ancillary protein KefG
MAKILILFAHPALEKSRIQLRLIRDLRKIEGLRFHDLYEAYPDFDIDVYREQKLLLEHDYIVLMHPFYWYSAPAIIKQWLDLVLEHNWAYGSSGNMLTGKRMLNVISSGGSREAYTKTGRNRLSVREYLAPFEQTAVLCKMIYWPPFAVQGTHRLDQAGMDEAAGQLEQILKLMAAGKISDEQVAKLDYLNDLVPYPRTVQS